ncbi:Octapeptide-repeat protein T2, partial [Ophiophagus hannah]
MTVAVTWDSLDDRVTHLRTAGIHLRTVARKSRRQSEGGEAGLGWAGGIAPRRLGCPQVHSQSSFYDHGQEQSLLWLSTAAAKKEKRKGGRRREMEGGREGGRAEEKRKGGRKEKRKGRANEEERQRRGRMGGREGGEKGRREEGRKEKRKGRRKGGEKGRREEGRKEKRKDGREGGEEEGVKEKMVGGEEGGRKDGRKEERVNEGRKKKGRRRGREGGREEKAVNNQSRWGGERERERERALEEETMLERGPKQTNKHKNLGSDTKPNTNTPPQDKKVNYASVLATWQGFAREEREREKRDKRFVKIWAASGHWKPTEGVEEEEEEEEGLRGPGRFLTQLRNIINARREGGSGEEEQGEDCGSFSFSSSLYPPLLALMMFPSDVFKKTTKLGENQGPHSSTWS